MSLVKSKYEEKVILDFSQGSYSKSSIRRALSQAEIREVIDSDKSFTCVNNYIKIGIYELELGFSGMPTLDRKNLKDYGKFYVNIIVKDRTGYQFVNPLKDLKFANQYWVKLNDESNLGIQNLVDVIMHLKRLDNLKSFL